MKKLLLAIILLHFSCLLEAQKKNESFRLNIRKSTGAIIIDGKGDDSAWKDTEVAKDFFMVLPMDDGPAKEPSARVPGRTRIDGYSQRPSAGNSANLPTRTPPSTRHGRPRSGRTRSRTAYSWWR